jgi:hypothetical protein
MNTYRSLALILIFPEGGMPVDIVALIAAIASIFGCGGTVTPDDQPTIHVNSS